MVGVKLSIIKRGWAAALWINNLFVETRQLTGFRKLIKLSFGAAFNLERIKCKKLMELLEILRKFKCSNTWERGVMS